MARTTIPMLDAGGTTRNFLAETDPDGNYMLLQAVTTEPPSVLSSPNILTVGTSSILLSSISGGIPSGATHALLSVAPGAGNVYFTEDGTTAVVGGPGVYVPAGGVAECTNLASVKVIADAASTKLYPSFRRY